GAARRGGGGGGGGGARPGAPGVGGGGGGRRGPPPRFRMYRSLEVAFVNSPFPAPPYFSRSSIVASNVATKSASMDNSYIQ
ncbi:hypothetical protein ACRCRM_29605, partial [Pseudomonas aeruginosa]